MNSAGLAKNTLRALSMRPQFIAWSPNKTFAPLVDYFVLVLQAMSHVPFKRARRENKETPTALLIEYSENQSITHSSSSSSGIS